MSRQAYPWVPGAVLALAVGLAGCNTGGSGPATASVSGPAAGSPSTASSTVPPTGFTPAPSGAVDEDLGETVGARPQATWDAAAQRSASAAGLRVVTAFARRGAAFDGWWARLEPLLAPGVRADYRYVDPASVPATRVTGPPQLLPAGSASLARVRVPTDGGAYTVLLSRLDGAAPWLAERITPEGG